MKGGPATPKRLTHSAAARAFDAIENAKNDLDGTLTVFSRLLDSSAGPFDGEDRDALLLTLERHITTDREALAAAIHKAHKAIVIPLHAEAHPNAASMTPMEMVAATEAANKADGAEGAAGLTLVVDNGGSDAAA